MKIMVKSQTIRSNSIPGIDSVKYKVVVTLIYYNASCTLATLA